MGFITLEHQKVFNNRNFTVADTILRTLRDAWEWLLAQTTSPSALIGLNQSKKNFQSPLFYREGFTTYFTNAAWIADSKMVRIGWTFESFRDPIMEQSASIPHIPFALIAKALAMRTKTVQFVNQIVKSVSQLLIWALNLRSPILEIHGILSDIMLCSDCFKSIKFQYISRTDNVKAYQLAKMGLRDVKGYIEN